MTANIGKVRMEEVDALFARQLEAWDVAKNNYAALANVKVKELVVGNAHFKIQFNPARIVSSAAKVDAKSIKERKCFLCESNRPAVQEGIDWGGRYEILVNPFPIFPRHLTIPCKEHTPQRISDRIGDMMAIAHDLNGYILFYNGPKCGASAPDHMHFQAGNKGFMTFDKDIEVAGLENVVTVDKACLSVVKGLSRMAFLIKASDIDAGEELFKRLYDVLPLATDDDAEPMLNILCWQDNEAEVWNIAVFPRVKHRPSCYFKEGDANMLITPASVDMGGVFITPLEKDFVKITSDDVAMILDEVCMTQETAYEIVKKLNK